MAYQGTNKVYKMLAELPFVDQHQNTMKTNLQRNIVTLTYLIIGPDFNLKIKINYSLVQYQRG